MDAETVARSLRLDARAALETAGLPYAPDAHIRYLTRCRIDAEPIALEIRDALEGRALPESDDEHSVLAALDVMATFGCALVDHVYRFGATGDAHRDAIRRAVSAYVVGSAIVDHVCDHVPRLLPLVNDRLSVHVLARVLDGTAEPPALAQEGDPALLVYLDDLFTGTVRLCRSIVVGADEQDRQLWPMFVRELVGAYGAELASATPGGARQVEAIWATPFWLALGLVAATPDSRQGLDFDAARVDARSCARLLAMIDDVVDVQEDWASGAGNQLLELAKARAPQAETPWPALAEAVVTETYMDELAARAGALSAHVDPESLAAWLHYWLGP